MKRILLIFVFLTCFFSCAGDDVESEGYCTPFKLTVKNSSEYIVKRLYLHSNSDYSTGEIKGTDVLPGNEIEISIDYNEIVYFTFVRNISLTSGPEIYVTTKTALSFEKCHEYILHLLEEDFFLKKY